MGSQLAKNWPSSSAMEDESASLERESDLEEEVEEPEVAEEEDQSHPCRFCSALFSSEVKLILHFHEEHFVPQKKKISKCANGEVPNSSSDEEDDKDEFESDFDSESDKASASPEEEDEGKATLEFLTDYERALLEEPVFSTSSSEDEADNTERVNDEEFWRELFGSENGDYCCKNTSDGDGCDKEPPVSPLTKESPSTNSTKLPPSGRILPTRKSKQAKCSGSSAKSQFVMGLLPLLQNSEEVNSRTNRKTTSAREVQTEIKQRSIKRNSQLECVFCVKGDFKSYYGLCTHIRKSHLKEQPYFCKLCDDCFTRDYYLTRHMQTHHVGASPYRCKTCSASFLIRRDLMNHKTTHLTERQFECEHCKMRFILETDLDRHFSIHTKEKSHQCDYCTERFVRKAHLDYHMKDAHGLGIPTTNNKVKSEFRCSVCDKTFPTNSRYQAHAVAHTKEKRFECEHCKMQFARSCDRNRHVKTSHVGLRPFKCDKCEKSFPRRHHLDSHIKNKHKLENPFSCQLCKEKFTSGKALLAHKRLSHPESIRKRRKIEKQSNS